MSQGENIGQIIAGVKQAIGELRSVDRFLGYLDSLDARELEGSEYLGERFFSEERNYLFKVMNALESEILPELEKGA
ncbi:hypothetical protein [Corynebacterium sp. SA-MJD20WY100]|uniref:hypothetical protein n=1 Tax=Corynebacterium sp. SA-MJD20WY100 TaxID=3142969 RepID=UPI0032221B49